MAPVSAVDLLQEIGAETGSQLLRSCKEVINPLGGSFIPSLDGYLTDEEPDLLAAFSTTEVQGPPKSGKTSLLLFLIMTTLLPSTMPLPFTRAASLHRSDGALEIRTATVAIGGRGPGRSILLFDSDGRFPLTKLARMLRLHIEKRVRAALERFRSGGSGPLALPQLIGSGTQPWDAPLPETIDAAVDSCLRRLLIWRPTSQTQLAASILAAKSELHARLPDCDAALIIVDSLSAFHWQELQRAEILGLKTGVQPEDTPASREAPQSHALKALTRLQRDSGAAIIVTTWVFGQERQADSVRGAVDDASPVLYKPALPWPYHAPFLRQPRPAASPNQFRLTRHISLVPFSANPGQFPPYMTVQAALEAEASGAARSIERERGHIVAWMRNCCDEEGHPLPPDVAAQPRGPIRYRIRDSAIEVM